MCLTLSILVLQLPVIVELERKALSIMSKQATLLIERRRQDVRDQAKEISESGSKSHVALALV